MCKGMLKSGREYFRRERGGGNHFGGNMQLRGREEENLKKKGNGESRDDLQKKNKERKLLDTDEKAAETYEERSKEEKNKERGRYEESEITWVTE